MDNQSFVEALIKMAKADLSASKLLLSVKLYSHSSFFLQQSVEKINKAIGISYGLFTASEARKTFHNHPELFKTAAVNQIGIVQELKQRNIDLTAIINTILPSNTVASVRANAAPRIFNS